MTKHRATYLIQIPATASNCSHNPKPKDLSVTECAVKVSHTSVITMCFKENVASIEVNRIRGFSRLCVLTRL